MLLEVEKILLATRIPSRTARLEAPVFRTQRKCWRHGLRHI
jgi:hypothetical protein